MKHTTDPRIFLFLSLGLILFLLCGVIAWTIRVSLRLSKVEMPKLMWLFLIACLQILLGILPFVLMFIVRPAKNEPYILSGLGITLLSGILFIRLILKTDWKQSLYIWSVAAVMQLMLLPICSTVLAFVFWGLMLWLYPPVF